MNRVLPYRTGGAYYTDPRVAMAIARTCLPRIREAARWRRPPIVLEASAGGGAFVHAVRQLWPAAWLHAFDVDADAPALQLGWRWRYTARQRDLLRHGRRSILDPIELEHLVRPDLSLGNPPFGIPPAEARARYPELQVPTTRKKAPVPMAERHCEHLLQLAAPGGQVLQLARLALLESEERRPFWRRWPARKVWVLRPRPSYSDDGKTDSTAYGVFWWDLANPGVGEANGFIDWR